MSERVRRVNELMRQILGEALGEMTDPGLGFVTVTSVDVSRDFEHAIVYVSVLGNDVKRKRSMQALERATGHLQARVLHPDIGVHRAGQLQVGQASDGEPAGQVTLRDRRQIRTVQMHIQRLQAGVGAESGTPRRRQRVAVAPLDDRQFPAASLVQNGVNAQADGPVRQGHIRVADQEGATQQRPVQPHAGLKRRLAIRQCEASTHALTGDGRVGRVERDVRQLQRTGDVQRLVLRRMHAQ